MEKVYVRSWQDKIVSKLQKHLPKNTIRYISITLRNCVRLTIDGVIYAESFLHSKPSEKKGDNNIKKVLIMRKDGLGDCIIFYPTLRAYREYYADAEITLIFPTYFESLAPLLGKDLVDHVIWFDQKRFGSNFFYRRRFLLNLKWGGYDIFIYPVFSRETIGYFMMKMASASESIGFEGDISKHGKKSEKRGTLSYTRLINPPEAMKREIDRDAYFAEKVTGQKVTISFPTIDVKKLPHEKAEVLLAEYNLTNKKYAVVFPGAGASYRIWPVKKFAEIIDYITDKGITAVVCGSNKETSLVKQIISLTKQKDIIDLSGKTDLPALSHILTSAELYFGSDTGILHLAVAVATPSVAIVGSGGLDRFFPYGDPMKNRAVYDKTHSYVTGKWIDFDKLKPGEIHPSIANISVADAQKEIDSVIKYIL
jgi:ADP-heptose:LPS heptosyltransferase